MDNSHTILIIDDEPIVRTSIATYLEDSGYKIIQAQDGEEGLLSIQKDNPDAVLCDLQMPNMGGLSLLQHLNEKNNDIPFIVVSGAGVVDDAIEALRLGAWDYIIKPIADMTTLEHALNNALDRKRLLDENQRYRQELETANESLKASLAALEEDQAAGRNIQLSLLPEKEQLFAAYRCRHTILPSLFLSGDFVDYFTLNDEVLVLYIADVSGHGVPSAFVTVLLKSLINQAIASHNANEQDSVLIHPDKMLSFLNQAIREAKMGKYLTMVYCVIDMRNNTLRYAVGGHYPYPILSAADQQTRFLEGSGYPVGVFERADYTNHELELPESFSLVMFSDGVLEILPDKNLADQEQFLLKMIDDEHYNKRRILDALNIKEDVSLELPDDITILMVTRED